MISPHHSKYKDGSVKIVFSIAIVVNVILVNVFNVVIVVHVDIVNVVVRVSVIIINSWPGALSRLSPTVFFRRRPRWRR